MRLKIAVFLMTIMSIAGLTNLQAQCDSSIVVSGWVFQEGGAMVPAAMAVNRNSGGGSFVELDGSFLIKACPGDTLVFGAMGYYSVEKKVEKEMKYGDLDITLKRLKVELGVAEVLAPRALREILRDIETLGYNEKDYRVSSIDAFQSPITFLYEQFSKVERSKRLAIELENNDKRRELLQELFVKYVDYDIIQLEPEEFKDFAEFCDPGDKLLKEWTQYEFIMYVKRQFNIYRMMPKKMDESDFQYEIPTD